jgi:hypothetical protein
LGPFEDYAFLCVGFATSKVYTKEAVNTDCGKGLYDPVKSSAEAGCVFGPITRAVVVDAEFV